MKLAIYAISKNEEKNVDRFMDSCRGIPVYVLDHSTDGTAEKLRARGAIVDTTPMEDFTFDKGKNFALSLVPADVDWVLNMSMDERLDVNAETLLFWLRSMPKDATIVRHLYKPDHEIDRLRYENHLHRRADYHWHLPIHEHLRHNSLHEVWSIQWKYPLAVSGPNPPDQPKMPEKVFALDELLLTQFPDRDRKHTWSKRLLDAVKEYPNEPRLRMLCGRDLFFDGNYDQALEQFSEFLKMKDTDKYDHSYVSGMTAKCYNKMDRQDRAFDYFIFATCRAKRREAFVDLAHAYMQRGQYGKCIEWARKALKITEGEYAPHSDPGAWGFKPHELIGIALYNLGGKLKGALRHSDLARTKAVTNEDVKRISENIVVMRQSL